MTTTTTAIITTTTAINLTIVTIMIGTNSVYFII